MDKDERVSGTVRNQRRRDDRLAKGGCRGKHTVLMGDKSIESPQLRPSQFAPEGNVRRKCHAYFTYVFQIGDGVMAFDEIDRFLKAASG